MRPGGDWEREREGRVASTPATEVAPLESKAVTVAERARTPALAYLNQPEPLNLALPACLLHKRSPTDRPLGIRRWYVLCSRDS